MTSKIALLSLCMGLSLTAHAREHAQGTGRTATSQPESCKRLCADPVNPAGSRAHLSETMRQNTCVCMDAKGNGFYPKNRDLLFGEPIGVSFDGWMSQDRIVGPTVDLAVPPPADEGFDIPAPQGQGTLPVPAGEPLLFAPSERPGMENA